MTPAKSENTAIKILDAALELFRAKGFEETTMREIAKQAGVATGAAYYYFPSKEAIVMAFYQKSCDEMQPLLDVALARPAKLDRSLPDLIRVKLDYFAEHREVLRALLNKGADPRHELSPFSAATKPIRDLDLAWFRRILADSGTKVAPDLDPHLADCLWLFQMGVIYFWMTDDSRSQTRTTRLLNASTKVVVALVKLAGLPLTRPLRKTAIELIEIVKGDA